MHVESLIRCWPELLGVLVSLAFLKLLIQWSGARLRFREITKLHGDQVGGVQTLSFVLTVPLFIWVMMFIVQLSQLTIAKVVVEYASFSAARAAVVWIPANTERPEESANRISLRIHTDTETHHSRVTDRIGDDRELDPIMGLEWQNSNTYVYDILPGSPKYEKIWLAAAMACMSISPSRDLSDVGGTGDFAVDASMASQAVQQAYESLDPDSLENQRIPARIRNKIAYALANTEIELQVRHKDTEVPLWILRTPWNDGWEYNEIGWQDQVSVKVTHHFALLPGPGRLLARRDSGPARPSSDPTVGTQPHDELARQIDRRGDSFTYSISATTRLVNQGHIPSIPYHQRLQNR